MPPEFTASIRTPAYVLDVAALSRNVATAARIKTETGAKILLSTKAWAMPAVFPLLRETLDGTTASGEYEARLGREEFGKEVHVFAPAYADEEVARLTQLADHIYFNSPDQLARQLPTVRAAGCRVGLRINPGYSEATVGGTLYDPAARYSRFGAPRGDLDAAPWDDIDILHVHALCEASAAGSVGLIRHVGRELGTYVRRVSAVNFGGGHFINKAGYDVGKLIAAIREFRAEFGVEVILEPGAGLVVDAGTMVSTVLAVHRNEAQIAILDASASCHVSDVLEANLMLPVEGATPIARPRDIASERASEWPQHTFILGGKTCMTGDVFGAYAFERPLARGDRVVFGDMMQYSFVKATTFNGTPLPDFVLREDDGSTRILRSYGYDEFRRRLG